MILSTERAYIQSDLTLSSPLPQTFSEDTDWCYMPICAGLSDKRGEHLFSVSPGTVIRARELRT